MTPDQEHQTGCALGVLEKVGVGSQSWKELRGSLREDFRERSEMRDRGVVVEEKTGVRRKNVVRKREKGEEGL